MSEGDEAPSTSSGQALVTTGKMPALRTATVALVVDRLFAGHAPGFVTLSFFPERGKVRPEGPVALCTGPETGSFRVQASVTPQWG